MYELPHCADKITTGSGSLPLTELLVGVFAGRFNQIDPLVQATLLRAALDGSADGAGADRSRYEMHGVESAVASGLLTLNPLGRPVFRLFVIEGVVGV